ncbi:MAG TPA: hypothetical protein VG755_11275 [Nannocystaceae bacterium]|nr:hypothetical protein [Nannocystaceae bacterium]
MIFARAASIGLLAASLVLAPARASAFTLAPDATALAVEGDAAHDAGRIRESADLYVRAYRAMTPEEKHALGEVIVTAAVEDLRACFDADPDPSFARTAGELLDQYERDTKAPLPATLAAQREWVARAREPDDDVAIVPDAPPDVPPPRPQPPAPRNKVVGPLAIGFGAAVAIGGAAMIGFGAPLSNAAERARRDAFADPRFLALPPADPATVAYVSGWDEYVRHEQRRTTALVAVGAILVGVGLGLAVYGVTRVVRQRRANR